MNLAGFLRALPGTTLLVFMVAASRSGIAQRGVAAIHPTLPHHLTRDFAPFSSRIDREDCRVDFDEL